MTKEEWDELVEWMHSEDGSYPYKNEDREGQRG